MSKEIKELDMNKYLVLKDEDIGKLHEDRQDELFAICLTIRNIRKKEGKKDNQYLILNLDDEINIKEMFARLLDRINFDVERFEDIGNCKVEDIAVDLVNAILKAKE